MKYLRLLFDKNESKINLLNSAKGHFAQKEGIWQHQTLYLQELTTA